MIQAGPKSHDGGVHSGFISVAYQVGMFEIVNIVPMRPADCAINTESMRGVIFFIGLW